MKQYELKDLETGKEYHVAFRNEEGYLIPAIVKVIKEYTVRFVCPNYINYTPLEKNKEYNITAFMHEYRGHDIFGQKFRLLWVFDNGKEALKWCIEMKNN